MIKVVYNSCYGGFGLSDKALDLYNKKSGKTLSYSGEITSRHDPHLVEVVEELGEEANACYANLKIEEVDGLYRIHEYDGSEDVETPNTCNWVNPFEPQEK